MSFVGKTYRDAALLACLMTCFFWLDIRVHSCKSHFTILLLVTYAQVSSSGTQSGTCTPNKKFFSEGVFSNINSLKEARYGKTVKARRKVVLVCFG